LARRTASAADLEVPLFKLVFCARRRTELTRAQFLDYWLHHHGPLFQRHAATYKALRYVQNHTAETPVNDAFREMRGLAEPYDGVGEIWWASEAEFLAVVGDPAHQDLRRMFAEDEARFIDLERSTAFFVEEHVLL